MSFKTVNAQLRRWKQYSMPTSYKKHQSQIAMKI